jgi:translation initiation factor IF-2
MAEEKMMRLSQAARKLNVSIITITEILGSKGHRIDNNPNAKLALDQLEILAKELNFPELIGESTSLGSTTTDFKRSEHTSEDDILYFREEVKESPSTPVIQEPEIIRIEHNLQGPKILGKIDLDSKKQPIISPIEEIKKEEVKIEKPILPEIEPKALEIVIEKEDLKDLEIEEIIIHEEPVESVIEKEDTVEITAPIEEVKEIEEKEIIFEQPIIEQPQEEIINESEKIEFIEEVIEAEIAEVIKEEKEEKITVEDELPTLIKAQGDKLQGLKVLGKIELPVERKPLTKEELKQKRKRKRVLVGGEKVGDTSKSNFGNVKDKRFEQRGPKPATNPSAPAAVAQKTTPTPAPNTPPSEKTGNNFRKDNKKGGKDRKEQVSSEDIKDNIKSTISKMQNKSSDFGSKYRKEKRKNRAEQQDALDQQELENSGTLKVTEYISAAELASLMDVSINEVIASCMKMGIFASINQRLDAETIQMVALEFGFDIEFISAEEEISSDSLDIVDNEEDLLHRAPIVTIMGHVDHGKTSLLDYIRRAKVASGEAGGITQHIGAYSVNIKEGPNKGKSITFLDTPGHEAFTAMRARGAKVTDVVIIVISADDSVMPQTKEAINHAQNAGVPIVFALNKIDKPNANPSKIREDLSKENILVESWGGKFQEQEVSAKSGLGIDELLDKVLLEAELLELKANPNRSATGTVIEAALDKGRGYVSTILVQTGTLKVGDIMLAGQYYGRVRAMVNDLGERITEAIPSQPVQILGLPGAPQAGDKFNIMETDREAREIANKREQLNREQSIRAKKHITLDEIGRRKAIGTFKELNVIVKGDVDGSVEALSDSLLKLSTEEVQVRIIHKAVGQISESDVTLASAADAIVIGFQVRPSNNAKKIAEAEQIEIRLYSIIYDAINEIKAAMEGMLAPKEEEVITGNISIREVFKISKLGSVAGCMVTDGYVKRNNKVRIVREGIVVHDGEIAQLKRFKDDVAEVKNGYECGLSIKNFNDIQVGDVIESYEIRELKRTL